MKRLLRWIATPLVGFQRIAQRGARRWAETPVGVELGLISGLALLAFVWAWTGWMALVLLLWSLPSWIDRAAPGGIRRVLRAIRRRPAIGILPLALPLEMVHLIPSLANAGGEAAVIGAVAGLLLPVVLGIWPDQRTPPEATEAGGPASPGAGASFVNMPQPRLTNVGPAMLTFAGAAIATVGVFLPWAWLSLPGTGSLTANGLYGDNPATSDGAFALGLAIPILVTAAARIGARGRAGWRRGLAIGCGLGLVTVALWHAGTLADDIAGLFPPASGTIGPGLGVVGFGGAMAFVGGLLPGRRARLATDFLAASASPFSVKSKASRRRPFARG